MPTNVEEAATPWDAEHAPGRHGWTDTRNAALPMAAVRAAAPTGTGTGAAAVPPGAVPAGSPGARPASAAPRLLAGLAWGVLLLACWFCGGGPDLPDGGPVRLPATGDAAAVGRPPARTPARPHPASAPATRIGAPVGLGAVTEHD
ncbi:hypothetical protein AB0C11_00770 [Streptomyces sp. NPDC039016]|uniref:hypothetical protein n=1 Tax=Streptomyces sp. NPDC039016 TaxID=3154330 RepID=UPI0033F02D44